MAVTIDAVAADLAQMEQIIAVITSHGNKVGTASDTPFFRDTVRSKVEILNALSQSLKSALVILRDGGDPNVDSYEQRLKSLTSRLASALRPFLSDGRDRLNRTPSYTDSRTLLLERDVDEDLTDRVDMLEHEARQVLTTMREVTHLFHATCEELKRQRRLLTKIDTHIERADGNMKAGIGELRIAQENQRRSSKCICSWCLWVFAIVAITAGVIYFIVFYPVPSDDTVPGTDSP
jgi:hypothetical protein